ncbi:MAG: 4-hydroxy-tetrahydrodipicolinate reductase [Treponema sp.]|jgi:4-hydroxy-tetrahydrodipicolinate reductase|nr:4-hydroxy-tetrahydrodipicolinate reductase [Treponema sp.]
MKIALVGYGKMGHMIEQRAKVSGHDIVLTIDTAAPDASVRVPAGDYDAVSRAVKSAGAQGIIEFSHPSAVIGNIRALLPLGLPVVVGTTGWTDREQEIDELARNCGGIIMHSSNFSIGVNMFYRIVEEAAKIMQPYADYDTAVWEMHHNQKADSPSGTALEIAKRIMKYNKSKTSVVTDAFHKKPDAADLHVSSTRCGFVPGTHTVFFDGPADSIEITHRARSREGFAAGAVAALERLQQAVVSGRLPRGHLYTMDDLF